MQFLGLSIDVKTFFNKIVVERERKPRWVIAYLIYLYGQALSLQQVADTLLLHGVKFHRRGVHYWVQKTGKTLDGILWESNGGMPNTIVVDETKVKVGSKEEYLYAAICPETKRIIHAAFYQTRNTLTTMCFFKQMIRHYGRIPTLVIIDGGPWYPRALNSLGIEYQVVSGKKRNYIERWYKTYKRRIKAFDRYFPHKKDRKHLKHWLNMFVFFYNRIRKHRSLGAKPPLQFYKEVTLN